MYSAWAEPESMSNAPRSDGNIRRHVFRLWFLGTAGSSPGLGAAAYRRRRCCEDVQGHLMPRGDRRAVDRLDDATGRNPRATTERSREALASDSQEIRREV